MKEFKSAFKPAIEEYLEFRAAMGYCNEHERQLRCFDKYCYEWTSLFKKQGYDNTPVCKVPRFICVCTSKKLCTQKP